MYANKYEIVCLFKPEAEANYVAQNLKNRFCVLNSIWWEYYWYLDIDIEMWSWEAHVRVLFRPFEICVKRYSTTVSFRKLSILKINANNVIEGRNISFAEIPSQAAHTPLFTCDIFIVTS